MDNENEQVCLLNVMEEDIMRCFDDKQSSAPVEVLSEFLSTLMARNYKSALYYCKLILQYEPDNEVVQDFYPLIQKKLHSGKDEADENSDESMSTLSDASTEYFTSTSVMSANTSICSSLSSDEEELSLDQSE